MRDVLYRAKPLKLDVFSDQIRKKISWVYGSPLVNRCSGLSVQIFEQRDGKLFNWECAPGTLGQWTGLTDKNGKKIFEGDIVQKWVHRYREKGFEPTGDRLLRGDVYWTENEGGFSGIWAIHSRDEEGKPVSYGFTSDFEVVGNIHDNPELLEEKDHGTEEHR